MGVDGSERDGGDAAAVDSHVDGTVRRPSHQETHPLTEGEFHQLATHKVVQQPKTSCGKVIDMPDSPLFIADAPIKDPRQPNLHDLMVFGEVTKFFWFLTPSVSVESGAEYIMLQEFIDLMTGLMKVTKEKFTEKSAEQEAKNLFKKVMPDHVAVSSKMDFFAFNEAIFLFATKSLPKSTLGAKMAWTCLVGNRTTEKQNQSSGRRSSLTFGPDLVRLSSSEAFSRSASGEVPGDVVHVDETDGGQAVPASGKSMWNHVETWIQKWEGESDEVYDAASVISMVYRVREASRKVKSYNLRTLSEIEFDAALLSPIPKRPLFGTEEHPPPPPLEAPPPFLFPEEHMFEVEPSTNFDPPPLLPIDEAPPKAPTKPLLLHRPPREPSAPVPLPPPPPPVTSPPVSPPRAGARSPAVRRQQFRKAPHKGGDGRTWVDHRGTVHTVSAHVEAAKRRSSTLGSAREYGRWDTPEGSTGGISPRRVNHQSFSQQADAFPGNGSPPRMASPSTAPRSPPYSPEIRGGYVRPMSPMISHRKTAGGDISRAASSGSQAHADGEVEKVMHGARGMIVQGDGAQRVHSGVVFGSMAALAGDAAGGKVRPQSSFESRTTNVAVQPQDSSLTAWSIDTDDRQRPTSAVDDAYHTSTRRQLQQHAAGRPRSSLGLGYQQQQKEQEGERGRGRKQKDESQQRLRANNSSGPPRPSSNHSSGPPRRSSSLGMGGGARRPGTALGLGDVGRRTGNELPVRGLPPRPNTSLGIRGGTSPGSGGVGRGAVRGGGAGVQRDFVRPGSASSTSVVKLMLHPTRVSFLVSPSPASPSPSFSQVSPDDMVHGLGQVQHGGDDGRADAGNDPKSALKPPFTTPISAGGEAAALSIDSGNLKSRLQRRGSVIVGGKSKIKVVQAGVEVFGGGSAGPWVTIPPEEWPAGGSTNGMKSASKLGPSASFKNLFLRKSSSSSAAPTRAKSADGGGPSAPTAPIASSSSQSSSSASKKPQRRPPPLSTLAASKQQGGGQQNMSTVTRPARPRTSLGTRQQQAFEASHSAGAKSASLKARGSSSSSISVGGSSGRPHTAVGTRHPGGDASAAATSPFPAPWAVDWSGSGKGGTPDISPMHIVRASEAELSILPESKIYEDGDDDDVYEGWEGAGGWDSQGGGYKEEALMMRGTADPTNSLSQLDSPVATMKLRPEIEEGMPLLHRVAAGRHNHSGRPSSSLNSSRMRSAAAVSDPPAPQADPHDSSPVADHSGEVPGGDVGDEEVPVAETVDGGRSGVVAADGMGRGAVEDGVGGGGGIFPEQVVGAGGPVAVLEDDVEGGVHREEELAVSGGLDDACTVDQTGGDVDGLVHHGAGGEEEGGENEGGDASAASSVPPDFQSQEESRDDEGREVGTRE